MKRFILVWLMLELGGGVPAWADRVHLANGQTLEGLVIRKTGSEVVVQVAWEGHLILDPSFVTAIEPSTEPERRQLLAEWRNTFQAFQEREQRRRDFEEQQVAKGLVQHRGQWVTQEELTAIKAGAMSAEQEHRARAQAEQQLQRETDVRQKLEAELREATQRLRSLQEEQVRLQQEMSSLHYLLGAAFLQPHPPFPRIPTVLRDAQGHLLRVQQHEGHLSVVTPDGTHGDLQMQDDRFSFTDPSGTHHDLEPVTP